MSIARKIFGWGSVAAIVVTFVLISSSFFSIQESFERMEKLDAVVNKMDKAYYRAEKKAIDKAIILAPKEFTRYELRGNAQLEAQRLINKLTKHYNLKPHILNIIRFKPVINKDPGIAGEVTSCVNENGEKQRRFIISLNEILFLHNYEYFMNIVIPHEVAHLVTCLNGGYEIEENETRHAAAHGEEWLDAMRVLGFVNPNKYIQHDLDTTPVVIFQYDLTKELRQVFDDEREKNVSGE